MTRCGTRCPRAARRRLAFGACSRRAPISSSRGAATAWCSAASTSSPARGTSLAIIPAGTANLFASNLGIPESIEGAVDVGLHGARHDFDLGRFNGERFAVMAGAGFDAAMIRDAGGLKDRIGRGAYIFSGSKNLRMKPFRARIDVDGARWYKGKASCILLGNVGALFGGIDAFEDARPDDGVLELGIVTADGIVEWSRTIARATAGTPHKSPFVQVDQGPLGEGQARSQGPLRARRRRSHEGQDVQGQGRAGRDQGLRTPDGGEDEMTMRSVTTPTIHGAAGPRRQVVNTPRLRTVRPRRLRRSRSGLRHHRRARPGARAR